jgi:Arc/MetJ-type ribon-helix-helix transcriptional regulator
MVKMHAVGARIRRMNIKLPSRQQKWLENQVAAGHFGSLDEALALAVADLMAAETGDLAWAKPYVDQARASLARGDVISGSDYLEDLDRKAKGQHSR